MHWVNYFLFAGALVYGTTISKEWRFGEPYGPVAPNLKFIVTVEGKSYFADSSVGKNWTGAGDYCKSLGMKLASITSKAQADALLYSYDATDFGTGYWTSARDAHLTRQFSWNETEQEVSPEYLTLTPWNVMYRTCVYYYSRPNNGSHIGMYDCDRPGYFTLCET